MHDRQDVVMIPKSGRVGDPDEQRVLQTVRRLADRLGARVEPELLEARVRAFFARFEGAQVREFVPILVEREVRREFSHPHDRP